MEPGTLARYDNVTRTYADAKGSYSINCGMRTNVKANLSDIAGQATDLLGARLIKLGASVSW